MVEVSRQPWSIERYIDRWVHVDMMMVVHADPENIPVYGVASGSGLQSFRIRRHRCLQNFLHEDMQAGPQLPDFSRPL